MPKKDGCVHFVADNLWRKDSTEKFCWFSDEQSLQAIFPPNMVAKA
jgi:hypothetical protein